MPLRIAGGAGAYPATLVNTPMVNE